MKRDGSGNRFASGVIETGDGFRCSQSARCTEPRLETPKIRRQSRRVSRPANSDATHNAAFVFHFPHSLNVHTRIVLVRLCCQYSEPSLDQLLSCRRAPHSSRSPHASQQPRHHSRPTTPTPTPTPSSTPPPQHSERSTRRCAVDVRTKRSCPRRPCWTSTPSERASSCRCSPRSPRSPTRPSARSPACGSRRARSSKRTYPERGTTYRSTAWCSSGEVARRTSPVSGELLVIPIPRPPAKNVNRVISLSRPVVLGGYLSLQLQTGPRCFGPRRRREQGDSQKPVWR